tara:strand:- start:54 stop:224 length:171 start_codon:yes stop_codon:yes gene_type:complete
MEIKYLPHPCSTAEKKEWNKKGFRVLDSRFAPVEPKKPQAAVEPEKPKAETKKPKA